VSAIAGRNGALPVKPDTQENADVLIWLGDLEPQLDDPVVLECGHLVVGVYGGNTRAGARKNEDAAFVMTDLEGQWEFAVLLDAHYSSGSARLVLEMINREASEVREKLESQPVSSVFRLIEDHLVSQFSSPEFLERASDVYGEASCLICARKEHFLWWMSVGDCLAYLLHPHLSTRGQFTLNQRSFFEWVGYRNTFSLPVPCYSSGVRELREGRSVICLASDGVFEGDDRPLISDEALYRTYVSDSGKSPAHVRDQTRSLLSQVHKKKGRDSATIIAWDYANRHDESER
jgi:serine/threonine protein phosphatase PrpC